MEQTVVFANNGILDLRLLTTFGVNVKPGTVNPIGQFGTGMKHGIAVLLREGCKVKIKIAQQEYEAEKETKEVRGKDFEFLFLRDVVTWEKIPLPFTTELGKSWELWMAYRELWSNCMDEGGEVFDDENEPSRQFDTEIIVEGEKFLAVHWGRDAFLLSSPLLAKGQEVDVHELTDSQVFYHGICVLDLLDGQRESLFSYNLTGHHQLTEDRTLQNHYGAKREITKALLALEDEALLEKVLTADKDTMEGNLDFSDYPADASETFMKKAFELGRLGKIKNYTIKQLLKRNKPKEYTDSFYIPDSFDEMVKGRENLPEKVGRDSTIFSYLYDLESENAKLLDEIVYWRKCCAKLAGSSMFSEEHLEGEDDDREPF
jgi:hypothetical protein